MFSVHFCAMTNKPVSLKTKYVMVCLNVHQQRPVQEDRMRKKGLAVGNSILMKILRIWSI